METTRIANRPLIFVQTLSLYALAIKESFCSCIVAGRYCFGSIFSCIGSGGNNSFRCCGWRQDKIQATNVSVGDYRIERQLPPHLCFIDQREIHTRVFIIASYKLAIKNFRLFLFIECDRKFVIFFLLGAVCFCPIDTGFCGPYLQDFAIQ